MDKTVETCPRNLTETVEASTRLGCGRDKYGNDQYICLPNLETTRLVEFCHDGIMGIIERGNCLKTAEDKLFTHKCSHFVSGCPDVDFRSNEIFKYPACQGINTEHRCYLADPSCPNTPLNVSTEETTGTFISKFTSAMDIQATTYPKDDSEQIGGITGIIVVVLTLILLVIIVRVVWNRMHRQKKEERDKFPNEEEIWLKDEKEKDEETIKEEEMGFNSKQKNNEHGVTEVDICNEKENKEPFITEGCVNSEAHTVTHSILSTSVSNEQGEKEYAETESGRETDVDSDSETEKQEEITETEIIQGMQDQRRENIPASKFRKPKDNSLLSTQLNNFFSRGWQHGVGHLLCCDFAGTAFRVGDRYLLTAFHIIETTMDACLKTIIENAMCDPNRGNSYLYLLQELEVRVNGSGIEMMIENGIKEWITKCKDNVWISSLLEAMKATGFSVARENILKIIGENQMQIVFGRMKEHEEGMKYPVKYDIPFYSKTEDIAILEIDSTNLSCLPMAFALERSIITPESIHIVGYPASHGRKQIFDPKCPLISNFEARSTLEQWKAMYPKENFKNFSIACDSAFSGREKVLFHCSESTAHGASGSPGLILSDTDKPKVYLML